MIVTISTAPMQRPSSMAFLTAMKCGSKRRLTPTISLPFTSSTTLMQALTRATSRSIGFSQKIALPARAKRSSKIGMGVGRRADHDGVDVIGGLDRFDGPDLAAVSGGNRFRGGRKRIRHGNELGVGVAAHGFCMHLADAPGAEQTKSDESSSPP